MNYREKVRNAIACPQFGDDHYGEWGALSLDQRKLIKRLLDELDNADDYIKFLLKEKENLKSKEGFKVVRGKTIVFKKGDFDE